MNDTDKQTPKVKDAEADFCIDTSGQWFHDGAPIKREALAKLFSDRALKIDEDGNYWLQTPHEKYAVDVEDVPYVAIDYDIKDGCITFRTNMQEEIKLSAATKWEIRNEIPYFEVRKGLFAKLGRSVFYNLIETFGTSITSDGESFPLGKA